MYLPETVAGTGSGDVLGATALGLDERLPLSRVHSPRIRSGVIFLKAAVHIWHSLRPRATTVIACPTLTLIGHKTAARDFEEAQIYWLCIVEGTSLGSPFVDSVQKGAASDEG